MTLTDKSLNLPPPVRPYTQQHYLPFSTDTNSNVLFTLFPHLQMLE